jgi:hypothetical protein
MTILDQFGQNKLFSMANFQQQRLEKSHQIVTMKNFDEKQTHILRDRYYRDVIFKPGESKEIDIIAEEIPKWLYLARTRPQDQVMYETGFNAGKPIPPHPMRIISGISESYLKEFNSSKESRTLSGLKLG